MSERGKGQLYSVKMPEQDIKEFDMPLLRLLLTKYIVIVDKQHEGYVFHLHMQIT